MPASPPFALVLENLEVTDASLRASLRVTPPSLRVSEQLAATALACRPALAHHICKQQGIGCFADKLVGTTLPHLVEHIAIDLLVEETPSRPQAGNTTWIDHAQGRMMVRLSSSPHTVQSVRTALIRAVDLVNTLLG
ncbi:MAG: hypothetical protein LBC23_03845 [Coriobacteriales bacterium]|jgi:hypothetical protein|nr:hypothetical protein [Coriobacteriales bacterium]